MRAQVLREALEQVFAAARGGGRTWASLVSSHQLVSPITLEQVLTLLVQRADPSLRVDAEAFIAQRLARVGRAPASGALAGIFANAARTTAKVKDSAPALETPRCRRCGAPREGEAVARCQYCQAPFFEAPAPWTK